MSVKLSILKAEREIVRIFLKVMEYLGTLVLLIQFNCQGKIRHMIISAVKFFCLQCLEILTKSENLK